MRWAPCPRETDGDDIPHSPAATRMVMDVLVLVGMTGSMRAGVPRVPLRADDHADPERDDERARGDAQPDHHLVRHQELAAKQEHAAHHEDADGVGDGHGDAEHGRAAKGSGRADHVCGDEGFAVTRRHRMRGTERKATRRARKPDPRALTGMRAASPSGAGPTAGDAGIGSPPPGAPDEMRAVALPERTSGRDSSSSSG